MYKNALIPVPSSPFDGEFLVTVPLDTTIKTALYHLPELRRVKVYKSWVLSTNQPNLEAEAHHD
jgi:hypothetical protein